MADRIYLEGAIALLRNNLNPLTVDIRAALVSAAYVVDSRNDQTLADIPAAAIMATSELFTGKTFVDGVFDAADAQFGTIDDAGGAISSVLVVYVDTGVTNTSTLLCVLDMAFRPNGSTFSVDFSDAPDQIFTLAGNI